MHHIYHTKRRLVFVGDSIIGHTFESFFAEMYRLNSHCIKENITNIENTIDIDIIANGGAIYILHCLNQFKMKIYWIRCVAIIGGGNTHTSVTGKWNSTQNILHNLIQQQKNGIVLIANIGLWYNDRRLYRREIFKLLDWLQAVHSRQIYADKHNLIGWRETTAQHFDQTPNGYFKIGPTYKHHR